MAEQSETVLSSLKIQMSSARHNIRYLGDFCSMSFHCLFVSVEKVSVLSKKFEPVYGIGVKKNLSH